MVWGSGGGQTTTRNRGVGVVVSFCLTYFKKRGRSDGCYSLRCCRNKKRVAKPSRTARSMLGWNLPLAPPGFMGWNWITLGRKLPKKPSNSYIYPLKTQLAYSPEDSCWKMINFLFKMLPFQGRIFVQFRVGGIIGLGILFFFWMETYTDPTVAWEEAIFQLTQNWVVVF